MFYVFVARASFIVTPHLTARSEIDDNCTAGKEHAADESS